MALIKCKECGHMISDRAIKCPKCGTPVWAAQRQDDRFASASNSPRDIMVETKSSNKTVLYVIIGILVAALGVLGYFLLKSDKNDNQTNNSSEAHVGKFDGHYEWVGTVGAYGANMKLDINNGHATGLYHYDFQKEGVNLSLSGECKEDGTLTLEETTPAGRNSGRFVGKLVDGSFSGTFYNLIKGTTFPFSLSLETDANPKTVKMPTYKQVYQLWSQIYDGNGWEDLEGFKKKVSDKNMSTFGRHISGIKYIKCTSAYSYDDDPEYPCESYGYAAYYGINVSEVNNVKTNFFGNDVDEANASFSSNGSRACGIEVVCSGNCSNSGSCFNVYFKDKTDAENFLEQFKNSGKLEPNDEYFIIGHIASRGVEHKKGWYVVSLREWV